MARLQCDTCMSNFCPVAADIGNTSRPIKPIKNALRSVYGVYKCSTLTTVRNDAYMHGRFSYALENYRS